MNKKEAQDIMAPSDVVEVINYTSFSSGRRLGMAEGYLEATNKNEEFRHLCDLTHRFLTEHAAPSKDNKQYLIEKLEVVFLKYEEEG